MILRFVKQITAPTIFSKGIAQYHQNQYGIAKQLIAKAGLWMPSLTADALFQAVMHLCNYHLEDQDNSHQTQAILDALLASPHKETENYTRIISDIKNILDVPPQK